MEEDWGVAGSRSQSESECIERADTDLDIAMDGTNKEKTPERE